jgi:glycosyltransferase involved in cell wall biosynthesis
VNPLVSVIIATYNSSSFIIDTFESIAGQTWQELELIVTDDCSTDCTIELCRKWIHEHRNRFFRTELLTSPINSGVSANANRGLSAAKGEWIKFLGADDTLKTNCIEDNIAFVANNPEVKVLFSQVDAYRNNFEINNYIKTIPGVISDKGSILSPSSTADSQYRMLLLSDRVHFSPSLFIHRETLLSIGGFDERFPLMEDYPLWLNLTKAGSRLHFMDKVTVNYRRHSAAINNTNIDYLIRPNYFRSEDFRRIYTYPYLPRDIRLNQQWNWIVSRPFRSNKLNRKTRWNSLLLNLLTIYLNPFKYFLWLHKRINKKLESNEFYM